MTQIVGSVLVIGASRGFGLSLTTRLASLGVEVVGVARQAPTNADSMGRWIRGDALSQDSLRAVRESIATPRHLVFAAGVPSSAQPAWSVSEDDLQSSLDTHLIGFANCVQVFGDAIIATRGSILLVGSRAARQHIDLLTSYSVGKAAAEAYARALSAEAPTGVRVNVLGIAAETGLAKTHRRQKEEIRGIPSSHPELPSPDASTPPAVFLLSEAAAHITGQTIEAVSI